MNNVDPLFVLSNQIEAALWTLIAVGMAVATLRRSSTRRECAIGAVAFALFGVSDLVETTTGAWWRPWWLLAWKAACVLTFLWLLKHYVSLRTPGCGSPNSCRQHVQAES